jgi:hypothetical protein
MSQSDDIKIYTDLMYKGPDGIFGPDNPFVPGLNGKGGNVISEMVEFEADGTTDTYPLLNEPFNSNSILVFLDGIQQSDYIINGKDLIFSVKIPKGITVSAWYIY